MPVNQAVYLKEIPLFDTHASMRQDDQNSPTQPLAMSGKFRYQAFHNGLNTHASDAVEQLNTKVSSEIPPSISFNFLFSGVIHYSFGRHKYQLSNANTQSAQGSFIVNNQSEIFTRHLTEGMHIKKLNIFVEKTWLLNRCDSEADFEIIDMLFKRPDVYLWQPSKNAVEKAEALIQLSKASTFADKLNTEHLTMELLVICLDEAYQLVKAQPKKVKPTTLQTNTLLKTKLDQSMTHCFSLAEIANDLNMSISTLQRQFKRTYELNISDYIKQHRLTLAKKSLLVDGLSIGEVAFATGYKHSSNFIHAFKTQFGLTPAAFVKLHKIR